MSYTLKETVFRGVSEKGDKVFMLASGPTELDRTQFVTASEAGSCIRELAFKKRAMAEDEAPGVVGAFKVMRSEGGWGFFERGDNVEAWLVDAIRRGNRGRKLMYLGEDQRTFVHEYQAGTPDGIEFVANDEGVVVHEFKSTAKFHIGVPEPKHVRQVIQNLDLVARHFGKVPVGGNLLYVNCSDYTKIYEFEVPYDEDVAMELRVRARQVMTNKNPAELKPEGMFNSGCRFCAFTAECSKMVQDQKGGSDKALKGHENDFFG